MDLETQKNTIRDAISLLLLDPFNQRHFFGRLCVNLFEPDDEKKYKKTKEKGDLFETFCQMYLQNIDDLYSHVWLLKQVPYPVLELLGLTDHDVGIDLVC